MDKSEYTGNYSWRHSQPLCGQWCPPTHTRCAINGVRGDPALRDQGAPCNAEFNRPQGHHPHFNNFHSQVYPSVYRETTIRRDDRGKYIDPFKNKSTKPYGRQIMYDPTHPNCGFASQHSSELADMPGPYSFPTTTGLTPEIPWCKDLQWKSDGETGEWPTHLWKDWTRVAECPPYHGHDDQVEYSKYKNHVLGYRGG